MPFFPGSVVAPKEAADPAYVGVCVGSIANFAAGVATCVDRGGGKDEEGDGGQRKRFMA